MLAVMDPLHADVVNPVDVAYLPAAHPPEHAALTRPVALPNLPRGHGTHADEPISLYCPMPQMPVHDANDSPVVPPNFPGAHGTHEVHVPVIGVYVPTGQISEAGEGDVAATVQ